MSKHQKSYTISFVIAVFFSCMSNSVAMADSWSPFNSSLDESFSPAVGTWYGNANGGGTGGACGFDDSDVESPPFNGLTAAGNQNLFKAGKGCGSCYQVKCTENSFCSGFPVTVVITNECPGACNKDPIHFDLSGKAFGFLAKPGQGDNLRNLGRINIQYQRRPCRFSTGIALKIDKGSNPFFLAFAVEYVNGDGDVGSVDLLPANSGPIAMQQSFGLTWKANLPSGVKGPFGVKLTTVESRQTVALPNIIPANWVPGQRCQSRINIPL